MLTLQNICNYLNIFQQDLGFPSDAVITEDGTKVQTFDGKWTIHKEDEKWHLYQNSEYFWSQPDVFELIHHILQCEYRNRFNDVSVQIEKIAKLNKQ